MNLAALGLHLVKHEDFFADTSVLPTFSCRPIEWSLHRIPGLSDRFLYFNDDMMFGADVTPDDFVTARGQKIYLTEFYVPEKGTFRLDKVADGTSIELPEEMKKAGAGWYRTLQHINELLDAAYGPARRRFVGHLPYFIDKAVMRDLLADSHACWGEHVARTVGHRFRTDDDMIYYYLYAHFLMHTKAAPFEVVDEDAPTDDGSPLTFGLSLSGPADELEQLFAFGLHLKTKFLCFQDGDAGPEGAAALQRFLEAKFPDKSKYEK
jgi:hypothetical protein